MKYKITAGIIAIVIIAGVVMAARHNTRKTSAVTPSNQTQTENTAVPTSTVTMSPSSMPSATPAAKTAAPVTATANITITATDDSASQTSINVSRGTKVNLTFKVSQSGVYHGGLEFISSNPSIDSGPIATGDAKTVSFVANNSFSFQPYWYASQIKKDYLISIHLQ